VVFFPVQHLRPQPSAMSRPYSIVVWGATGFTGRLVCEHIAKDYKGSGLRWAMAGRNQKKMEELRESLKQYDPEITNVPIEIADAQDFEAIQKITQKTDVVIATAGPFTLYGSKMVEACVKGKAHYVDITGEVGWMRDMIDSYHGAAKEAGVKIVHTCGYDSQPADLGTYFVVSEMRKRGMVPKYIEGMAGDAKGGFSGGTAASLLLALETGKEVTDKLAKTRGLNPDPDEKGDDPSDFFMYRWSEAHQSYTAPFVMAGINTRVVRRSRALYGEWYGPKLVYSETSQTNSMLGSLGMSSAMGLAGGLLAFPPTRWMLSKFVLPKPGEGPSRDLMMSGFWTFHMAGVAENGQKLKAVVQDKKRDPGYWGTARMLLESALCLALNQKELQAAEPALVAGGVLTPATAMGPVIIDRLQKAGITFEVSEVITEAKL